MTKMTEREMYAYIKEQMAGDTEVEQFCDKKIEAINKKNEQAKIRNAKKRAEGNELTQAVKDVLTEDMQTISEITNQVAVEGATPAKVSYQLNQLAKACKITKGEKEVVSSEGKKSKKVAYSL